MADQEWFRISFDVGIAAISWIGGMIGGAFHSGRSSAKREDAVKEDYTGKIGELREEVRTDMARLDKDMGDARDLLVGQFKESFEGIRRQFDEHRLSTEKDFMRKDDFRDFREEYREDMRELKATIANMARSQ